MQNDIIQKGDVNTLTLIKIPLKRIKMATQLILHFSASRMKLNFPLLFIKGNPTALVMLDLSTAFDTIDHTTLIDCLTKWFGWNQSYLCDRFQWVLIDDVLSDSFHLPYGVPQWSVLGPILYSLYTYPLSHIINAYKGIKYHFYADKTQIYCHLSPSNHQTVFTELQDCLNDIQNWMGASKPKLNPDETEFIMFSSPSTLNKVSHDIPSNILCSVRNLGVLGFCP
jgi:hypothetical protein